MKWRNSRQSENVEDRRGGGAVLPLGGIGTLVLAAAIYFLGGDPSVVLNQPTSGTSTTRTQNSGKPDEAKQFVSAVLGDTEDVWTDIFKRNGRRYKKPTLVLFSNKVSSACGIAGSATGPFYCPRDEKLYIDLSFFRELKNQLGAPGDFAQAYVIAHEVGHHVQNQMGTMEQVDSLQERAGEKNANALSVRLELQADFYAGVWAHYAEKRNILEAGDVEEALGAASAVGDDRLQNDAQGYVVPDSFTHGTSKQRMQWFELGYKTGDVTKGNTFKARLQ